MKNCFCNAIVMKNMFAGIRKVVSINIRVYDELKNRAYRELNRLGATPLKSAPKPYNTLLRALWP